MCYQTGTLLILSDKVNLDNIFILFLEKFRLIKILPWCYQGEEKYNFGIELIH